jgi:hypothetical protein
MTAGDTKELFSLAGKLPAGFAAPAVVAATAATAIAITAKAAAVAAKATTSAATAAAIFARLGFVDFQGSTADFFAIELIDGGGGFLFCRHFDESKASRTSGHAVFDHTR